MPFERTNPYSQLADAPALQRAFAASKSLNGLASTVHRPLDKPPRRTSKEMAAYDAAVEAGTESV